MEDLEENLEHYGFTKDEIPFVIQYNKRDLDSKMPVEELREDLNPGGKYPDFKAQAIHPEGPGVFDTLKALVKQIIKELKASQN
jgi:hypothetical protein